MASVAEGAASVAAAAGIAAGVKIHFTDAVGEFR